MDFISKCKSYLIQFDYPSINILDEFQIVDLFTKENRYRLLSWLVRVISSSFVPAVECSVVSEKELAQYLIESGFCRLSEGLKFVEGVGLDSKQEVVIFERIFSYLHYMIPKSTKQNLEEVRVPNINLFLNQDINIFPSYGALKLFSEQERKSKLAEYENEVRKLEEEISELYSDEDNSKDKIVQTETSLVDFNDSLQQLKIQTDHLAKAHLFIKCHCKKVEQEQKILENKEPSLIECAEETEQLAQVLQNYQYIYDVSTSDIKSVHVNEEVKQLAELIKIHATECELIQILKN